MSPDGRHDFDFMFGDWRVAHQRLRSRLTGCTEWEAFDGMSSTRPILGGAGNLEDNRLDPASGSYRAVALRSWCAQTRQWSIWWLDGRQPLGIDVPVRGRFEAGLGAFYAEDRHEGRLVQVRFRWDATDPQAPRWEQALSADGGQRWEVNWRMQFTRA
jgi:hypothetical protein